MATGEPLELISTDEIATLFRVTPRTARTWLRTGRLRGRRIGKRWYASRTCVLAAAIPADASKCPTNEATLGSVQS